MPDFNPFEPTPGPTPPSQETTEVVKPKRRGRPLGKAKAAKKPAKAVKAARKPRAVGKHPALAAPYGKQDPSNGAVLTISQAVALVRQIEGLLAPFDKDVRRHLIESVIV